MTNPNPDQPLPSSVDNSRIQDAEPSVSVATGTGDPTLPMRRYKVVAVLFEMGLESLEKQINIYLEQGWTLAGGISASNHRFLQAMVLLP